MILVNLTCGRNPWKKASPEDSTFRAFLKDPQFLSTILPLSPELNSILRRVFECDPRRRISLPRLRELIVACPRLTVSAYPTLPPTPPAEAHDYVDVAECANLALPPSPVATPSPASFAPQASEWSLFDPGSKRISTHSSGSSDSGYESDVAQPCPVGYVKPQAYDYYGALSYHTPVDVFTFPGFVPQPTAVY